jgi:hypothetical protein
MLNFVFKNFVILFIVLVGSVTTGYFLGHALAGSDKSFDRIMTDVTEYDYVSEVSCKSNSMGLTVNCDDEVYISLVKSDDPLYIGYIYTYKDSIDNHSIIHRLVYCLDSDCNSTVFKGDNNQAAELVNRNQIVGRVVSVKYE